MAYTTIKKPSDYFNTLLWTGNSSTQSITGNDFIADLTWSKSRSDAESHILMDTVRDAGTTLNQALISNSSNAEGILNNSSTLTVNSTGFDLDGTSGGTLNFNSYTYATWLWKAGGTGVSNTDGSITSTVSANTTSGFSIVSYTGTGSVATVGHGLGSVPKMIIIKKRNSATGSDWYVYHVSNGNDSKIWLNQTSAKGTGTHMNNTTPTSSVFSIGTPTEVNNSGDTYIAYCFSEVKGFSKFGSYTGNGSTDGTFVYTGFKPAFFICKNSSTANTNWLIFDNKRASYNLVEDVLKTNQTASGENGDLDVDFLSNGIKMRNADGNGNENGSTMIYMAFAEEPLVGDNPCTAR